MAVCVCAFTSSRGLKLVLADSVLEVVVVDAVARMASVVEKLNIGCKERRDPRCPADGGNKHDGGEKATERLPVLPQHDNATNRKPEHLMVKFLAE